MVIIERKNIFLCVLTFLLFIFVGGTGRFYLGTITSRGRGGAYKPTCSHELEIKVLYLNLNLQYYNILLDQNDTLYVFYFNLKFNASNNL